MKPFIVDIANLHKSFGKQAVLQGVGHATALQAPQALAAEIVRFLNSPRGTP